MRTTILAFVVALLVVACPALASGGDKGDWELGIFGGYGMLDDYGDFRPDDDMLYGGRIGYFLSRHWNLEFSAQRLATDTEFDQVGVEEIDVKMSAVRLNLLYNFGEPGKTFRPFLTGGVGSEKFDAEPLVESSDVGWNAGAGFRVFMSPHWNLRLEGRYVGVSVGGDLGESQGNAEVMLGLGWVLGGSHEEVEEIRSEPAPNQPPTVSCSAERQEILPGESVNLGATATDPEGDALTYEWSASAGRVTGNGATATFDFTGATPPSSSTITVRVTDTRGNAASSDCSVRLMEPVRPAEAVSCIAGGFPRNLSRLNNVDKACLDDVAQRLGADPRARVIVIGHADSRETARVGQLRAEAVRDYLSKDRSIEVARITLRPAAIDAGADATARAGNRRVEVWFVPEGAAEPR